MEGVALGMKALVGGAVGKRLYFFPCIFTHRLSRDKMSPQESIISLTVFFRALCLRRFSWCSISHHGCDG